MQLGEVFDDGQTESEPAVHPRSGPNSLSERLKTMREKGGANTPSGIPDNDPGLAVCSLNRHGDGVTGPGEFYGIGQQVPDDLLQSRRVADDRQPIADGEVESNPFGLRRQPDGLDRTFGGTPDVDELLAEREFARHDPRQVEHVIDEGGLSSSAAFNRLHRHASGLRIEPAEGQQLSPPEDGRQGGPQLVREGGQELVLGAIGLLSHTVEAGVLDGDGCPARELDRGWQVAIGVAPAGPHHDQGHSAEHAVADSHRNDHQRSARQDQPFFGICEGSGCSLRSGDDQPGLPGAKEVRDGAAVCPQLIRQRQRKIGRSPLALRDSAVGAVVLCNIDSTPVSNARNDEVRKVAKAGLVIERSDEDRGGLEKKSILLFQTLAVRDVAREAARVNELAILEEDVGVDRDVPDRTVPGLQARFVIPDLLVRREPLEDVTNDRNIGMKFSDVASDVVLCRVSQKLELGLIRPENRSIRSHPVQGHGGVFEEILQLELGSPTPGKRIAESVLQLLTLCDLPLQ